MAAGLSFEKSSPRNKCVQDGFPLAEDFRAFLLLGTELDFIRTRPAALKASACLTFAKIVRWQRTQRPKCLVPHYSGGRLRPHMAAFQLSRIELGWNLPQDKPVGSFVSVFPTKGSCSRELTCFPHLSVHIAKPIFPRLQRWTAWCDQRYGAGGSRMF